MLFSLIANASIQNYLLEVPLLIAGMSQLFLILYFGDRLIDASLALANATYSSNWVGKSIKHQKRVLFIIGRAHKPKSINVGGDAFAANISLFSQV